MMKKLGNITSILLSLGIAAMLAFMIIKPTSAPKQDEPVQAASIPAPSKPLDVTQAVIQLSAITLPPPPAMEAPKLAAEKQTIEPIKVPPVKPKPTPKLNALKVTEKKPTLVKKLETKATEATPEPITLKPLKFVEAEPVVEKHIEEIEVVILEQPANKTPEVTVTKSGQETKTGRALLKLLEHGTGPSIEIAWPDSSRQQAQLHDIFSQCFGMVTAVMDHKGSLYRAKDNRGQSWDINTDRYSGFVRQPSGQSSSAEQKSADTIRRHHNVSRNAQMVRVFPRQVDALLLGGLHRLVGPDYAKNHAIRARYQIQNGLVKIGRLNVDGAPLDGTIALHVNPNCQGSYAL